jgi:hypothetical protein
MAYSTIPAAKAQILATLQARPGLAGVLVRRVVPTGEVPPEPERVYVDDVVDISRDWAMLGLLKVDEEYTIKVLVEVWRDGDDPVACETRLFEVVAEVEQAIVSDVTLAGVFLQWAAKPALSEQRCLPGPDGWLAFATVDVLCKARI